MAKRLHRPGELWKPDLWPVRASEVAPEFRPLWRDLILAVPAWDAVPTDVASRRPPSATDGTLVLTAANYGMALDLDGSTGVEYPVETTFSDRFTFLTFVYDRNGEDQFPPSKAQGARGGTGGIDWELIGIGSGNVRWKVAPEGESFEQLDASGQHSLNTWEVWAGVYVAGDHQTLYKDGAQVATRTPSGTVLKDDFPWALPAITGSFQFDGLLQVAYVWTRELSAAEVRLVSDDPDGVLRRAPRRVYRVPDPGGTTPVSKTLAIQWDTAAAVGDTVEAQWDTHAAVGDATVLDWAVATVIGDSVEADWATRAAVAETVEAQWGVAALAGDTADLQWDAAAAVGDTVAFDWSVATTIGDDVQADWSVLAAVGDSLETIWDVASTGTVGDTISLRWGVRGVVSDDVALEWDVAETVGDALELDWSARLVAGETVETVWSVYELAGDSLELVWDVDSDIVAPTFAVESEGRSAGTVEAAGRVVGFVEGG